jgi:carboxymethylenebutenolidase
MIERTIEIETRDGRMSTFITHPELDGPHPVVIVYMDAPGIREELRDFARRIGTVGYYCMLPQLFYRDGGPSFPVAEHRTPEQTRRMQEIMAGLSNAMIVEDTRALLRAASQDPAAKRGVKGCVGYCMSGQYVVSVAGTFPEEFQAMASLHGVKHVTDKPDSPHKLVPKFRGEQYFGFAENDPHVPVEDVRAMQKALQEHRANALVEIHPGTEHGFVFPGRKAFHKHEAERAWERIFALFRRVLG